MTDRLPINYGDTWKVARDKINDSFNEVVQTVIWYRPHIENWYWWIWDTNTWVYAVGIELRAENNLIKKDSNSKTYTDLQFQNWLTPTSAFPIWITVWNVDSDDWWAVDWIMVNSRTENSYSRMLYWEDWKLYFDWWIGTFKAVATSSDLTSALETLRSELATVAFTWKSSDLNNDADFNSVPVMTMEQYEETPWTAWDDKRYLIFEEIN